MDMELLNHDVCFQGNKSADVCFQEINHDEDIGANKVTTPVKLGGQNGSTAANEPCRSFCICVEQAEDLHADAGQAAVATMGDGIPADVFMSILQRIQLTHWRWLRLICRHWRDVTDARTQESRAHAKVTAFYAAPAPCWPTTYREGESWSWTCRAASRPSLTYTWSAQNQQKKWSAPANCNGLLCRRHDVRLTVINPVIR
jgi:hypothetical protein